jgi:hypothetical protein
MFYTVYKTVNLSNGCYYLGVHKTKQSDDFYLGSGTIIKRAITKYGEDNFRKEVLFAFDTAEVAYTKERELLSTCLNDPLCYNLHEGGNGGFEFLNDSGLSRAKQHLALATSARMKKFYTDPVFAEQMKSYGRLGNKAFNRRLNTDSEFAAEWLAKSRKSVKIAQAAWQGQRHTKASRQKMSEHRTGERNPMFGMRWMYNEELQQSKRFSGDEVALQQQIGWRLGRKFYGE